MVKDVYSYIGDTCVNRSERPGSAWEYPLIHLMGGTIMGTGAGNSVVNSYGQTHEIANLYVAGPGIFATEGASNPTYTVFAISLRGAEQLAAKWKRSPPERDGAVDVLGHPSIASAG